MNPPRFLITCMKCGTNAELDVTGARKDAAGNWSPANARRPGNWIAGPADSGDATRGVCPSCAPLWNSAAAAFLQAEHPPAPPPKPRQFDVEVAEGRPIEERLIRKTTEHAPHAPREPLRTTPVATAGQVKRPQMIQPKVSQATGGYGYNPPPPSAMRPVGTTLQAKVPQVVPPLLSKVSMPVGSQMQSTPKPFDATPSGAGQFQPASHNFATGRAHDRKFSPVKTANFQPAAAAVGAASSQPSPSASVSFSPMQPYTGPRPE